MRIAVLVSSSTKKSGGSYSYSKLLLEGILALDLGQDIELIFLEGNTEIFPSRVPGSDSHPKSSFLKSLKFRNLPIRIFIGQFTKFLWLAKINRKIRSRRLNRVLKLNRVDFVLSLFPLSFPLKTPFAMPVWDLQHRLQPYWPEVSLESQWELRESAFVKSIAQATKVIVGTNRGANELELFYGVARENIIVAPFPIIEIDTSKVLERNQDLIYYPAQFWPHKNHINLLFALQIALDNCGRNLQLVLPGGDKGNLKHVKNTVKLLSLEKHVSFPGFISDQELEVLARTANLMIFPSYFGPDNLPPLEALANGCKVAVSEVSGSREQFGDFVDYFNPDSPADIANAMIKSLQSTGKTQLLEQHWVKFLSQRKPEEAAKIIIGEIANFAVKRRNWK
jgi:glycosyltransferase involved in cell wall biosynthesis